jgi:hypothetical protein
MPLKIEKLKFQKFNRDFGKCDDNCVGQNKFSFKLPHELED